MSQFKVVHGYKPRNHVSLFLMFSIAKVFESDEFFARRVMRSYPQHQEIY